MAGMRAARGEVQSWFRHRNPRVQELLGPGGWEAPPQEVWLCSGCSPLPCGRVWESNETWLSLLVVLSMVSTSRSLILGGKLSCKLCSIKEARAGERSRDVGVAADREIPSHIWLDSSPGSVVGLSLSSEVSSEGSLCWGWGQTPLLELQGRCCCASPLCVPPNQSSGEGSRRGFITSIFIKNIRKG